MKQSHQSITLTVLAIILFFTPLHRHVSLLNTNFWVTLYLATILLSTILIATKKPHTFIKHIVRPLTLMWLVTVMIASLTGAQNPDPALIAIYISIPLLVLSIRQVRPQAIPPVILSIGAMWAQLGILQFILQSDLNLIWIGESVLAKGQPGVATFAWFTGEKILRAYGLFSHPNVFASSLILSLIPTLPHVKKNKLSPAIWALLCTISSGVILAFSRASLISLALIWLYIFFKHKRVRQKNLTIPLILLIISPLLIARQFDPADMAASERVRGYTWAQSIIQNRDIHEGSGIGQYEKILAKNLQEKNITHQEWEIGPVHSVPILFLAEWGALLSITTLALLAYLLKQLPKKKYILAVLLPTLLLDHHYLNQLSLIVLLTITMVILHHGRAGFLSTKS